MDTKRTMKPLATARRSRTGVCAAAVLTLAFALPAPAGPQQDAADLTRRLADPKTQDAAVQQIVRTRKTAEPLLLEWTTNPPPVSNPRYLALGMTLAFEQWRTKAAIPFLISNISVRPDWSLGDATSFSAILRESPAIRALIAIGEPAVDPLISAYVGPVGEGGRMDLLFTISQMNGPRVRNFLRSVRNGLAEQQNYVSTALKRLDAREKSSQ